MVDFDCEGFKHFFILEKHRIASYKSWPFNNSAKCNIQKMSEAGFYWSGNDRENDTATCFACGKVLDGWESTDDPWTEHVKHAPQCVFVKLGKPESQLTLEQFIDLVHSITKNIIYKNHTQRVSKLVEFVARKREIFTRNVNH